MCSVEDQACELDTNVLTLVPGVSLPECRMLCNDQLSCKYISFFGSGSFPLSDTCVLFSECGQLYDCEDCRTEDRGCWTGDCSSSVEGRVSDNLVAFLPHLGTELECRDACSSSQGCGYYTFYSLSSSSQPGSCFLLSSLQAPVQECTDCRTGASQCADACMFLMDGHSTSSKLQFTNTSGSQAVQAVALGYCDLTVLLVGGGGAGGDRGGAGGSGYVNWERFSFIGTLDLDVKVGGAGARSTITSGDGEQWMDGGVEGESGMDGASYGGEGYCGGGGGISGGGGGRSGAGGTDGGDGLGTYGAKGSGLRVDTIPIQGFQLM